MIVEWASPDPEAPHGDPAPENGSGRPNVDGQGVMGDLDTDPATDAAERAAG